LSPKFLTGKSDHISYQIKYDKYSQALQQELKSSISSREGLLYEMLSYHMGWKDQHGAPEDNPSDAHLPALLALATCEHILEDFKPALPVAAALELIHSFTTVHGDVQNGGDESPDRPSIWWVWGPSQAINAGDGLHALARTAIMRLSEDNLQPDLTLQAIKVLDEACLSFCEGQYMELSFQDQLLVTETEYLSMIQKKSGALPGCGGGLGTLSAGADQTFITQFTIFGEKLGMASQLTKDIKELWGPQGDGMTPSNIIQKKKSLPLIYAFEHSNLSVKRELGNIYMKRVLEPADTLKVIELLNESAAKDYTEDLIKVLISESLSALRSINILGDDLRPFESLIQIETNQTFTNDRT